MSVAVTNLNFNYKINLNIDFLFTGRSLKEGLKDSTLKEWGDIIKLQEHWIGECSGTNIDFQLIADEPGYPSIMTLWTDKPEYVKNIKFVALSLNNILSKIEKSRGWGNPRKLKAHLINPFTNEKVPIFVTDKGDSFA